MTSNRAKLQALIDTIDSAFGESSTPEAQARQQEAIAQTRRYLLELQQDGGESQEATAQQVLQAVVQEMSYLRTNMIQPLREEITQLHGERKLLSDDLRQLQQRQQKIKESQQQAIQQKMLQDFMQSLMVRLQDQMTTQVVQAITLMQPQLTASAPPADGAPSATSAEQAAELRALQATSNEMMLKMDSTLRVVFDSLQTTVDSYRESLGQGLEKMHSLGQQGETLFAALINRLASQLGREASQYLSQSLSAEWEASRPPLTGTGQPDSQPSESDGGDEMEDYAIADNPFAGGSPGATAADATTISADHIDQLLRQNLPQTASDPSAEVDTGGPPGSSQLDPDELIDQILQDLEADISAVGEGLNLNLDAVDLAAGEADAADTPDEAIALFQLGDEGVTVDESAAPSVEGAEVDSSELSGETDADERSGDELRADLSSGNAPELGSIETDQASLSTEADDPGPRDDIGSFYAEFQAATDLQPQGPDSASEFAASTAADGETKEAEPDPGPEQPLTTADSSAPADTIRRLSDLIDTDLLMQLGAEDASGVSSPYTMASLGEDLLPTVSDATQPAVNLDVNLDQLTADLSRIEGANAAVPETGEPGTGELETGEPEATEATISGFLSPDDDFFDIGESDEESDETEALSPSRSNPTEPTVEEAGSLRDANDQGPSTPHASSELASDELMFDQPSPGEPPSSEPVGPSEPDSRQDQPDPPPEARTAEDDMVDDDLIDDAAIDEIAALFAALERTEDSPSGRSAIAQQTLADLLKPAGDSSSGNASFFAPESSARDESGNPGPQDAEFGEDQKKK